MILLKPRCYFLLLGLIFGAPTYAQDRIASRAPRGTSTTSSYVPAPDTPQRFRSQKTWQGSRWYVLGRLFDANKIQWIDGGISEIKWDSRTCSPARLATLHQSNFQIRRGEGAGLNLEILKSRDWVAIEVNPAYLKEEFIVSVGSAGRENACTGIVAMTYIWDAAQGTTQPLFFISKTGNRYFGSEFLIESSEFEERADIQLDLLLGISHNRFPNAAAGTKSSLIFAPNAIARGEWQVPTLPQLGLTLGLSQTVASIGGVANQNALYSDWALGLFYQKMLRVRDGLQLRASLRFAQHLSDDNQTLSTIATANKNAQYFIWGFLAQIYHSERWLTGAELSYGLPNSMAGRGVKQSYMSALARLGVRMTTSMFLISEVDYQSFMAATYNPETQLAVNLGMRLEL